MGVRLPLPAALDARVAPALRDALLTLRGEDLELDGSAVERLGASGLQVLLSAQRTWREDERRFALCEPSPVLAGQLALFGLQADLSARGALAA